MSERHLIFMAGMPGSGKSRLGEAMVGTLRDYMPIEHVSMGDHIRGVSEGRTDSLYGADIQEHVQTHGSFAPMDDQLIQQITREVLRQHEHTQTLLLDGYPRYDSQVQGLKDLALFEDWLIPRDNPWHVVGGIITEVDREVALGRMLRRSERPITPHQAAVRLYDYEVNRQPFQRKLDSNQIPFEIIDTNREKAVSNYLGLAALRALFNLKRTP